MRPIEVRFDKNINNLSLVREADPRRQWEYITVVLLGAVFVFGLLFYGWQRYQYVQYGYSIATAQKAQEQLIRRRNELKLNREQLQDPTRIYSIAKNMGMVLPAPGQLVTFSPGAQENTQTQLSANK